MARARFMCILGALLLICLSVWAAPVKQEGQGESASPNVANVEDEDEDLQELLKLVNKQSHQDDVMVHKAHVTHIENTNGQSVKVEQKEEKVIDTDTGNVVADVKQQTQTSGDSADDSAPAQTVVETEVDVPAKGVHETFVQEGQTPESGDSVIDNVIADGDSSDQGPDLTPADMAAYLYASQQFEAFYAAMDRLVNESKMSPEEAEAYAKTVAMEYERLQLQALEDRYVYERRSYPQSIPESDLYAAASGYDLYPPPMNGQAEASDPSFDMLAYVNSLMSPEEQEYMAQKQAQADLLSTDTLDPYQFVAALWNEAYENGNEEAQEIVRMLYDRVSHDSNPDDMGEIRDILLDTVAQSLDDTPSYAYDTPIDTPLALPQMPVQPMMNEEAEEGGLDNSEGEADNSEVAAAAEEQQSSEEGNGDEQEAPAAQEEEKAESKDTKEEESKEETEVEKSEEKAAEKH